MSGRFFEKAIKFHAISLPSEAEGWCVSHNLRWVAATGTNYIVVWCDNEEEAIHYTRRWNGRAGRDWRANQRVKAVAE